MLWVTRCRQNEPNWSPTQSDSVRMSTQFSLICGFHRRPNLALGCFFFMHNFWGDNRKHSVQCSGLGWPEVKIWVCAERGKKKTHTNSCTSVLELWRIHFLFNIFLKKHKPTTLQIFKQIPFFFFSFRVKVFTWYRQVWLWSCVSFTVIISWEWKINSLKRASVIWRTVQARQWEQVARNNTFRNVLSSSKGGKFKFKKKKMDGLATKQILWVQKNLLCDKRLVAFWPATRLKKNV